MNTQRLFDAMILKLSLDQKKLEDELERTVNSDTPMDIKLVEFTRLLERMVASDASIQKFNQIVSSQNKNNNNTEQKNTPNG